MNPSSPDLISQPSPSTNARFTLGYRPELDGIRGISILLVFIHHVLYGLLPGGFLGVDIFFVLSGFLITSLLLQEWDRERSLDLKNFYIRRAMRLLPALVILALALGAFALLFLTGSQVSQTYQGIWLTFSYMSNWLYAFKLFSADNPLGITWSLAIEEQFYVLWPLILSLFLRFKLQRRWLFYGLSLGIAFVIFHRGLLVHQGVSIYRVYYASDTRADALLIGCLAGALVSSDKFPKSRAFQIFLRVLALLAFGFLTYTAVYSSWIVLVLYQGLGLTLIALSAVVILLVVLLCPPKPALLMLKFGPLVWVGRTSYGLYLWHWPVHWLIYRQQILPVSAGHQLLAAVFLSFTLTALSYYFVERPFLRWKVRFGLPARRSD